MDGKFLLQDLAELLAEAEGLQKNEAQSFVRVFFDTITRGLETDKIVKVKGLGTFKLVDVDSRESVNVNTGERFLIDGHAKITFTPDNSLKELVNRPFAHFETVVLNDEVTDEDLEEVDRKFEETVPVEGLEDFLAEEPVIPSIEPVVPVAPILPAEPAVVAQPEPEVKKPVAVEEPVVPVAPAVPVTPAVSVIPEEPAAPVEPEAPIAETPAAVETPAVESVAPVAEPVMPAEPVKEQPAPAETAAEPASSEPVLVKLVDPVNVNVSPETVEHTPEPETETKNNHFRNIWIVLCIVALLLGYLLGYFNVFSSKSSYRPSIIRDTVYVQKIVRDTVEVEKVVPNELITQPKAEEPKAEAKPAAKPAEQTVDSSIPQLKGGAYLIVGTKETYTLRGGETIRIIAERYFGSREMAPYIAVYNNIPNPDMVAAGTVLKIPELKRKKK